MIFKKNLRMCLVFLKQNIFVNKLYRTWSLNKSIFIERSIRDNIYIFHHVPKCGGTSINKVLKKWFIPIKEYRMGWTMRYPDKLDLSSLKAIHCVQGHFESDGYKLHQRYPEIFLTPRYRVFTFLRDPLAMQLSLFGYEHRNDVARSDSLVKHLMLRPNYIASQLSATRDNYKKVIDKYFFVGILERGQESLDLLANLMDKPYVDLPWTNKSERSIKKRVNQVELSQEVIEKFKADNELDYLIYKYCTEKLEDMLLRYGHKIESF